MAFKIKDLMINDLSDPRGYEYPFRTQFTFNTGPTCRTPTRLFCFATALDTLTLTFFWTPEIGGTFTPFNPSESLESLAILKEQLKQQLAQVEKQHAVVEQHLQPQTVEEVDALSAKLTEALEELKALRAKLAKPKKAKG